MSIWHFMTQLFRCMRQHYNDVIMDTMASQITSLTIVYLTVYSGADQRKHQSSASLAFVWGIHRGPVNSPHKWPVTRKMFPFDDVFMKEFGFAIYGDEPHMPCQNTRHWSFERRIQWISPQKGLILCKGFPCHNAATNEFTATCNDIFRVGNGDSMQWWTKEHSTHRTMVTQ